MAKVTGPTAASDVDVMATPFTNTLAVKRLNLSSGKSAEINVAHVVIPDLDLAARDNAIRV